VIVDGTEATSQFSLAFQLQVSDHSAFSGATEGQMSEDGKKTLSAVVGATAVVFGSAFGVVATAEAQTEIAAKQSFREKLAAITEAVQRGEVTPFYATKNGDWVPTDQKEYRVADWLQTWGKWSKGDSNWGKV
jgi:hypothetical protein